MEKRSRHKKIAACFRFPPYVKMMKNCGKNVQFCIGMCLGLWTLFVCICIYCYQPTSLCRIRLFTFISQFLNIISCVNFVFFVVSVLIYECIRKCFIYVSELNNFMKYIVTTRFILDDGFLSETNFERIFFKRRIQRNSFSLHVQKPHTSNKIHDKSTS